VGCVGSSAVGKLAKPGSPLSHARIIRMLVDIREVSLAIIRLM